MYTSGRFYHQGILPLPPSEGLSVKINTYDDVPEPKFDPKIHLNLKKPEYIRLFPNFEKAEKTPRVESNKGSKFAFSSSFQVRSNLKGL